MSYANYQLPPQATAYSSSPGAYPTGSYMNAPQQQQQQQQPQQQQFNYNDPFAPGAPPQYQQQPQEYQQPPQYQQPPPQQQQYQQPPQQHSPPPVQYDMLGLASSTPPLPTSQELVPHYGTGMAPSSSLPPRTSTPPPAAPSNEEVDPAMVAIIASQERAMEEAKNRNRSNDMVEYSKGDSRPTVAPSTASRGAGHVHPERVHMKQERKAKTAAGVAGGALVGGLMFGPAFPVGMVLGGAVGGYASNKVSKSGERRAQQQFEQASVQRQANQSNALHEAAYV